jgi:hypothetical protein
MRTLVVTAVALVALSGCTDDSGEPQLSKDRWIEQADEICEEEKSEFGDLDAPPSDPFDEMLTPTQLEGIAEYLRTSLEIQDRATGRLDGLGLPDEDADDIEDVLEHREDGKLAVEAAIDGARAADADRFTLHYRQAVADYGKASQAAREFGLEECGQP